MTKIFISYRRDDSGFAADRVHEAALDYVTDPKDVFMDIDGIPPGVDFVDHINQKVGQCDVLFALIGRDWLNVRDQETGERRLDDPGDFVRAEIAAALARDIPVVPVLLGEVHMPHADQLPDNLKALARRNAVRIDRHSFKGDMAQLMAGLGIAAEQRPMAASSSRAGLLGLVLLGVVIAGGIALFSSGILSLTPSVEDDPGAVVTLDPEPTIPATPALETRTRRLGVSILQGGETLGVDPVTDALGLVDVTRVDVERGPFQLRFPGSHWGSAQEDWPYLRLVISDDPALFDSFEPNQTVEDASAFFWACAYASYEFGSPEVLLARLGEGPGGTACGHHAYSVSQIPDVTESARTITISKVFDPDDDREQNLIETASRLYMIIYITERPNSDDFEAGASHTVSYPELDYLEFVFP